MKRARTQGILRIALTGIAAMALGPLAPVALPATTSSPSVSSQPTQHRKRIIGGHPDPYNDTSWVAALIRKDKGTQWCGGSLIASRYVLTAAHCTWNTSRRQWKVRLGSKRWDRGGVVRRVKRIFVYPHFNHRTLYGDLSVLKL